jgi:4-aminobutyrate aminotransferase
MLKLNVPGRKAQALIDRDKKVVSSSYPRAYPFVMDHGRGVEVWDPDGNRFIDFMSGIAVLSTGHANPRVVRAVQDAAEKFLHISSDFYHEGWVCLSEKLNHIAPFEENAKTFLTNSGTESVETAIKLAKYQASQLHRFLRRFPWANDGSGGIHCQQAALSPWVLSFDARCDTCSIPGSVSSDSISQTGGGLRRDSGTLHRRRSIWPQRPWG